MVKNTFLRLTLALGMLLALVGTSAASAHAAPGDQFGPTQIVNNSTNGRLLPTDYGYNHNDNIYMWAWNAGGGGDMWTFEEVYGGHYLIRNNATGKCLRPGGAYGGKTYVTQATCSNGYEFQWHLERRSYTFDDVKIVSRSTRQAMRPYYDAANQVVVLDANSNASLNWWSLSTL